MRDLFQEITDRITAQLATGVRPWAQPWKAGATLQTVELPHNIAGRQYRGANAFWLLMAQQAHGYARPLWLTFKQALDHGGNVRKGEKGTAVFFWKFDAREDKDTGEIKRSVMVRQYTVFNIAQCDNLEIPALQPTKPLFERIEAAEALAAGTGAVIHFGGARAFYSPTRDEVHMPAREAFRSADGLYSTLFHELGHWTGHSSRLAREYGKRFGDEAYAFEELVAELTAAFVCGSQGFASVEREDHAAYLGSWLKVLKQDSRAFITAAAHAQRAADLILKNTFGEETGEEPVAAVAA